MSEFQSAVDEVPKSLHALTADLPLLLDTLKRLQGQAALEDLSPDTRKALTAVIGGCSSQLSILDKFLSDVLPKAQDSKWRRGRKFILSLSQNDRIQRVESTLRNHIQTLMLYQVTPSAAPRLQISDQAKSGFDVPFSLEGVPLVGKFIGRAEEMTKLENALLPEEVAKTVSAKRRRNVFVLHGLGGIGKTQLAAEFSRRNHARYSAVFWVDGRSRQTVTAGIASIAQRLPARALPMDNPETVYELKDLNSIPPIGFAESLSTGRLERCSTLMSDDTAGQTAEVLKWLSEPGNSRWLLIFDNVDLDFTSREIDPQSFDPMDYFPVSDHGSIIVTTRMMKLNQLGESLRLGRVDPASSRHMLESRMGYQISEDIMKGGGRQLIEKLDGLPLALAQAGSYIGESQCTISEYLELYDESWNDLMSSEEEEMAVNEYRNGGIYTTWAISFKRIEQLDPQAGSLIRLWSCLDGKELFPEIFNGNRRFPGVDKPDWLKRLGKKFTFIKTIKTMLSYSLAERKSESEGYSMHPVVHDWIRHTLSQQELSDFGFLACRLVAENIPDHSNIDFWIIQRRLLPHANKCWKWLQHRREANDSYEPYQLPQILEIGLFFQDLGMSERAKSILETVLAECGDEHPYHATATGLMAKSNLAVIYLDGNDLATAEKLYEEILDFDEQRKTLDQITFYWAKEGLSTLYKRQGKFVDAMRMAEGAYEGLKDLLGEDDIRTIGSLLRLGHICVNTGAKKRAEKIYRDCLAWYEHAGIKDDQPSVLEILACLADILTDNSPQEAEPLYRRHYTGWQKLAKTGYKGNCMADIPLATFLVLNDKCEEAQKLLEDLIASRPPPEADTWHVRLDWFVRSTLGHSFKFRNRTAEAREQYHAAVETARLHRNTEDFASWRLSASLNNLATTLADEDVEQALELYEAAYEGYKQSDNLSDQGALGTMQNLARNYKLQGRMEESEMFYKKAAEGLEAEYGLDHERTKDAIIDYINFLDAAGKSQAAVSQVTLEMERVSKAKGVDHDLRLQLLVTHSLILTSQNRLEEAKVGFHEAISAQERVYGPESLLVARTIYNLAITEEDLGNLVGAEALYKRSLEIRVKKLTWLHCQTLDTALNLALMKRIRLAFDEAIPELEVVAQKREELWGPNHVEVRRAKALVAHTKRESAVGHLLGMTLDDANAIVATEED